MESLPLIPIIPIIAAIIGALVAGLLTYTANYYFFVLKDREKEQRRLGEARIREQKKLAFELLSKLMTDEYFVKARLISQAYLLPTGIKHEVLGDTEMNFIQIDSFLSEQADKEDREARFYIRAIPNFFWLVELAREDGLIGENEKIFSKIYSYYWTHIIAPRIKGCEDNEQFREFENLLNSEDKGKAERDHNRLVSEYNRKLKTSKPNLLATGDTQKPQS